MLFALVIYSAIEANFLQGLKDVGQNFDFYAFSDQEDIWEINKLEIA